MDLIMKNKLLVAVGTAIAVVFMHIGKKKKVTDNVSYTDITGTYCMEDTHGKTDKTYFVINKNGNFVLYSKNAVLAQGKMVNNARQKKLSAKDGYTVYYRDNYKNILIEKNNKQSLFEKISDIPIYINVNTNYN